STRPRRLISRRGLMPVRIDLVIGIGFLAGVQAVLAREFSDGVGGRGFELFAGEGHDIALLLLVVIERRPGQGVIFLAHPEKAAEADDGEHYGVLSLVENDVLDLTDLPAFEIVDIGADGTGGADGRGVAGCSGHEQTSIVRFSLEQRGCRRAVPNLLACEDRGAWCPVRPAFRFARVRLWCGRTWRGWLRRPAPFRCGLSPCGPGGG